MSSASESSRLGPADSDGARQIRGLLPGGRLGDYELIELLGKGAMGRVFRAHDPAGREVAIKVLSDRPEAEDAERFQREGQALAKISAHRHVVTVHTMGTVHGRPYLVLDLIEGQTLQSQLIKGPRPPAEAALLVEQLCDALDHIHQAGVLHRDLKPANILLRPNGEPVVTDFGMASLVGSSRLTRTGGLYGTPAMMSPEQILGRVSEVDGRTDVWALGVILYQLLDGDLPFQASNIHDLAQLVVYHTQAPLTDMHPELVRIVARALAKKKEDRFETPGHMGRALRLWRVSTMDSAELGPPPVEPARGTTRTVAAVVAALLVAALSVAGWVWWTRRAHEARRTALLTDRAELQRELREEVPNLLGRGQRWVRATRLDRFEARATTLEERAAAADVPLDTAPIHELLDYMRLELALRSGDESRAGELLAQLPAQGELARLVRARQALGRGEDPGAELRALGDSHDPQVAAAASVLLARQLADEDPAGARELLRKSGDEALIGPDLHYVNALSLIRHQAPTPANAGEAVAAARELHEPIMLARLRRAAVDRCRAEALERPLETAPVLAALEVLTALPPGGPETESDCALAVVNLVGDVMLRLENGYDATDDEVRVGIQVLDAAGGARLQGVPRLAGIRLFDGITMAHRFRGLAPGDYLTAVEAMIELDVPIGNTVLDRITRPSRSDSVAAAYLYLLWERSKSQGQLDHLADSAQSEEAERQAEQREADDEERWGNKLRERLQGEWRDQLGPRTRAAGLVIAMHERMTYEQSRAVVEEAYALDPGNPQVVMHMAQLCGIDGERQRCAELCVRTLELYRELNRARDLLGYSVMRPVIKDVVEVQAKDGIANKAIEMVQQILEVDDLPPEERVELLEDVDRWLTEEARAGLKPAYADWLRANLER